MISADEETLLKWAEGLARANTVLKAPVHYQETPLRPVTVTDVGRTAHGCLAAIVMARGNKGRKWWNTDGFWSRMEADSLHELEALRDAVLAQAAGKTPEPEGERPTAMQMRLGEERP